MKRTSREQIQTLDIALAAEFDVFRGFLYHFTGFPFLGTGVGAPLGAG
jgi:hypothetical protein